MPCHPIFIIVNCVIKPYAYKEVEMFIWPGRKGSFDFYIRRKELLTSTREVSAVFKEEVEMFLKWRANKGEFLSHKCLHLTQTD